MVDYLVGQVKEKGKTILIVLDKIGHPSLPPITQEFVQELTQRATRESKLRIALLDYTENLLLPNLLPRTGRDRMGRVRVEGINGFAERDLRSFFLRLARAREKTFNSDALDRLLKELLGDVTVVSPDRNEQIAAEVQNWTSDLDELKTDVWTLEEIIKVREQIRSRMPVAPPSRVESYHPAVALVTSFILDPEVYRGEPGENLRSDSMPAYVEGSARWSLKNEVRKRILQQLKTVEALRKALESTPDSERPKDPVQRMLEALLAGTAKRLDQQEPEELSATLQVVEWFSATDLNLNDRLPSAGDVRARIERAAFFQPFRSLVGKHFRGRKTELATLNTYVGLAGEVAALRKRPPLLMFGPGGMGKSTLIAEFVLEHLDHLPVIYLNMDRPGLAAEEPITFLAEAVHQLGLQFPQFRSTAQQRRRQWLEAIEHSHEMVGERGQVVTLGRDRVLRDFQIFVSDLGLRDRNILLVIDTFEEVYRRSRPFVEELFKFLEELQTLLPNLRTVLAGRHSIPGFVWEPLELGTLDQEASEGMLETLGVAPLALRQRLADLLQGNPLSLRLAAELISREEVSLLEGDLKGLTDSTEIQGVLYRRVLGHVREELKAIAHPGLILRRITPEIIRKVLAGPCNLNLSSDAEAEALFGLLRNELSLVNPEPEDNAVSHRPDVRQVMLRPLKNDPLQKDKVRTIELAAVAYYQDKSDPISRAEEIYHRLSLGQEPDQIERRWLPGVEASLYSAVDELEGHMRAYLASRLKIELYDQD